MHENMGCNKYFSAHKLTFKTKNFYYARIMVYFHKDFPWNNKNLFKLGLQVISPPAVLEEWHKQNIWLAPPQVYEISRFLNFQCYEKLKRFASQRGKKGLDHYFPVMINASNGKVSLLPGE